MNSPGDGRKANDLKLKVWRPRLQVIRLTRLDGEPVFVCQNLRDILQTPATKVKPFVYKDLAMSLQSLPAPRFVRRTSLGANEYRKNFRQIDGDVISAVTSEEADRVTPLMSKIYLRLVHAPAQYWERDGVLRFEGELRDDGQVTAWEALCEVVGVASATARKALLWMHGQGIVGYFAGKNGVGIRVFLNRAMSSIGTRAAGQKILEFRRASSERARTSSDEAAFSDSFADLEVSDSDRNPRAPKNGADTGPLNKTPSDPTPPAPTDHYPNMSPGIDRRGAPESFLLEDAITRLKAELEPAMCAAARQAAAREHERTREWLENRGLPKAARVAQHEAYNVLRKYGVIGEGSRPSRSQSEVGRNGYTPPAPHLLSAEEVTELAQACVAMLETQGQSIEVTLSEMSSEAGGFLLPEDAGRVREKANSLLSASDGGAGKCEEGNARVHEIQRPEISHGP